MPNSAFAQPLIVKEICPDKMILMGFSGKSALCQYQISFVKQKVDICNKKDNRINLIIYQKS
jgi:hypothetical protein